MLKNSQNSGGMNKQQPNDQKGGSKSSQSDAVQKKVQEKVEQVHRTPIKK